ncbi:large-conductance mechanosensitive channel protein MscL [Ligilactobacillus araffinosus]|uniref:Large-conductance mechanosensitive channel n=1 Tax=Ligilactobacillus araffinosus DSM 20653 TaxID=1423820 RepID=A0A0R1ZBZ7_9LACO|nr:large-conductance mechanosensitive channel protein MscL [Ligilactobacillus araffinosus]KRM52328.1 large-conductance mechanosensitive channel [Ligilactobacillus araffinosus DSM 20653]
MLKEFKEFIARGNVMDLAVGVIVGSAFTAIVKSLVSNIINPLIGIFAGKIDFSSIIFTVGAAHFRIGTFLNSVINFLIISFVIFIMVKFVNKFAKNKEDEKKREAAELSNEAKYLKEIVELLEEERLQDSENKREKDTKTTVKE